MDQNEDAKGQSADKATPGPIDAKPAAATGQPADAKAEIASIEAPSIVPSAAPDAPKSEAEKPAAKPDAAAPKNKVIAAVPVVATSPAASRFQRPSARLRRIAPLAAAAVVGLAAGAFGATALPQLGPLVFGAAPSPAAPPPAEAPAVTAAISQMRADLAALKASTETTSRSTSAQLTRLSERFDRIERAQTTANKADMVVAKETTGSITPSAPPSAAAAPLPPAPVPQGAVLSSWMVRDVVHGAAILQGRLGGMIEVGPGDIVPGIGRVESIRRQDGRWVVITARGMILSMR